MNLTENEAIHIVNSIHAELKRRQKQAVIAVADSHGELISFLRMDKAKLHSINLAMNKAYTAARAQKATSEIGRAIKDPQNPYDIAFYGDSKYTGFGGGVPVIRNGVIIGAVGVSALSQEEDEELALLGVQSLS